MKQIKLFAAMVIFFYLVVSFLKLEINPINLPEKDRFLLCGLWTISAFINVFWYLNGKDGIK